VIVSSGGTSAATDKLHPPLVDRRIERDPAAVDNQLTADADRRCAQRRHGRGRGGGGSPKTCGTTPCKANRLCTSAAAVERGQGEGSWCQSPAMPNGRCRLHGGKSPGAPKGNTNAFKHGRYSAEAIEARRKIAALLRTMRTVVRASRQADAL
jgi:hypothetical protein